MVTKKSEGSDDDVDDDGAVQQVPAVDWPAPVLDDHRPSSKASGECYIRWMEGRTN